MIGIHRADLRLLLALVVLVALLLLPLLNVVHESFLQFTPGRVGSTREAPYTLANYTELLHPAYFTYFANTFRLSLIASGLAAVIAFPISYFVARRHPGILRTCFVTFLVGMMFLGILVRVYSLALTFGPVGFLHHITGPLGLNPNGRGVTEALVVLGLLHYGIPMSALILVSTIQNVSPHLIEAAEALGSARWSAHLSITVPLSRRGIISAFLITFTLNVSAFIIPMILGKGKILFVSNLIYSRFGEIPNYPSGAAISVVMSVVCLVLLYGLLRFFGGEPSGGSGG